MPHEKPRDSKGNQVTFLNYHTVEKLFQFQENYDLGNMLELLVDWSHMSK
jgi:hypothetical protein